MRHSSFAARSFQPDLAGEVLMRELSSFLGRESKARRLLSPRSGPAPPSTPHPARRSLSSRSAQLRLRLRPARATAETRPPASFPQLWPVRGATKRPKPGSSAVRVARIAGRPLWQIGRVGCLELTSGLRRIRACRWSEPCQFASRLSIEGSSLRPW